MEWKKKNKIRRNTPFSIKIQNEPFFFAPGIFTNINKRNYFSIITTPPPPAVKTIPYKKPCRFPAGRFDRLPV